MVKGILLTRTVESATDTIKTSLNKSSVRTLNFFMISFLANIFYNLCKYRKAYGFLILSGVTERELWLKKYYILICYLIKLELKIQA